MTFEELFENALRLVAEDPTEGDTSDYEDRASYILATFCSQCASADARYRQAHKMSAVTVSAVAYVELSEAFPLCDAFAPAATYYLAAMLTLDENEVLSEKFFALYTDALATIQASLPALRETVTDSYGLI